MRKIKVLTVLLLSLFFVTGVNANNHLAPGNDYTIKEVNKPAPSTDIAKVWELTYNAGEKPITVEKRVIKEHPVYVVHSEYFGVCYASTSKGFGTRSMKRAWCGVPLELTHAVINTEEIKKQQVILPKSVDDETALDLIASYLPNLINDNYKHLLN
jgi:hypothetical protein